MSIGYCGRSKSSFNTLPKCTFAFICLSGCIFLPASHSHLKQRGSQVAARHAPPSLCDITLISFYLFSACPPSGHIATAPSSRAPIRTTCGVLQAPQPSEWLHGKWANKLSISCPALLLLLLLLCWAASIFARSRSSFDGCRGCRLIGCHRNPSAAAHGPVGKLPQTGETIDSTRR